MSGYHEVGLRSGRAKEKGEGGDTCWVPTVLKGVPARCPALGRTWGFRHEAGLAEDSAAAPPEPALLSEELLKTGDGQGSAPRPHPTPGLGGGCDAAGAGNRSSPVAATATKETVIKALSPAL